MNPIPNTGLIPPKLIKLRIWTYESPGKNSIASMNTINLSHPGIADLKME